MGRKLYPNLLKAARLGGRVGDIRMLSSEDGYLPGYEAGNDLEIQVLGPVPEQADGGRRQLRTFTSDDGPTKNGHSIILKLRYRKVSVLLGGDLNIPAEEYLLERYAGPLPRRNASEAEVDAYVARARQTFEVDIAKACHHGSADFSTLFLRAVNASATIVSSGDEESFSHPRPDALGAFGKYGRGVRPLIFSTELAHSARENIKDPRALRDEYERLLAKRDEASGSERQALEAKIRGLLDKIERSVAVYGMINLRTDGTKVIIAQKLEAPRGSTRQEWDVHALEPDPSGTLRYVSKHERH